jgi:polyhydroxyalkanoate synthesis regulator phasin
MTKEETEKLLTHATDCAEGECSLDEVQDLIDVLKAQQKELYDRVQEIRDMVSSLEIVNTKDARKVDEVRETVRAIYRIFQLGDKASGNDYPKLSRPTGWTGDVGKGPKTAYDALPPKKFKP